jgi:hypothetical protein
LIPKQMTNTCDQPYLHPILTMSNTYHVGIFFAGRQSKSNVFVKW